MSTSDITRQALWTEMRRLQRFTVSDICADRAQLNVAYSYLRALAAAGHVKRGKRIDQGARRFAPYLYELVRDAGLEAPWVRRDGSPITQGLAREQLWRSMRILRDFNIAELCVTANTPTAPVTENNAKRYVARLHRAGYLLCIRPSRPGAPARYRLLRAHNTGPRPPQVQANGNLYDPNVRRVVWQRALRQEPAND